MMPILLGSAAILGVLLFGKNLNAGTAGNGSGESGNPHITFNNPWKLPDIDPANQAGVFSRDYDESFEKAKGRTMVPFALIKAHALRESSLNPQAYHFDNDASGASYGLMQVEWNASGKNANRLSKYGDEYSADAIRDGSILYDPDTSSYLGASIIRDNLFWKKGKLRDAINAYNTGTGEDKIPAPAHYVDDVIRYYNQILGEVILS